MLTLASHRSPGSDQSEDPLPSKPSPVAAPLFLPRYAVLVLFRSCRLLVLSSVCLLPFAALALLGSARAPKLLRWYLEAAGGLFVKLGQILALRYDLIPARYCQELSRLLDALPALSTAAITRSIERGLGKRLAELFLKFDAEPLSCASVAQVHGATLRTGEAVVVKVVRPGVELSFRADLLLVSLCAHLLEFLGFGYRIGLRRLARELTVTTYEEFDLVRELRNAEQLAGEMRGDGIDHSIPKMYPAFSCRSVLTMERIDGIAATKLIAAVESQDREQLQSWSLDGINPDAVAALLLRSMLVQMFRHRLFHADPHSANLLICRGGKIVFVDFGIFGWLDERQWSQQLKMRRALAANRIHAAYLALVSDFVLPPGIDVSAFEAEIKSILWNWSRLSSSRYASIREKSAGQLVLEVFSAARRAGVGIPSGIMPFFRALIISDMVILKLSPRIDVMGGLRSFLKEETAREMVKLAARSATIAPAAMARLIAETPEAALDVLEWLEGETRGARSVQRYPETARSGRLAHALLNQGALLSIIFSILVGVRQLVSHLPIFDYFTSALGIDVRQRPVLAIGAGIVSFVLLRRAGMVFEN
jgi:ubiquinone biosynthesis protein